MKLPKTCVALVALVLLGTLSTNVPALLEEQPVIQRTGTADRVVIDDPPISMSADEVVSFEALI